MGKKSRKNKNKKKQKQNEENKENINNITNTINNINLNDDVRLISAKQSNNLLENISPIFLSFQYNIEEQKNNEIEQNNNLIISILNKENITNEIKNDIYNLLETNMKEFYINSGWGWNKYNKKNELFNDENSRILIVTPENEPNNIAAFSHFRFSYDDDDEPEYVVLYVWEIQIKTEYQRNGLGRRIMQILEMISLNYNMDKVMLTVFHENQNAMNFYRNKMNYNIDEDSPSNFQLTKPYEILSKQIRRK